MSADHAQSIGALSLSARECEVLEAIIEVLKSRLQPQRIVLFGSRAKGKSHPGSDFDLAVDKDRPECPDQPLFLPFASVRSRTRPGPYPRVS